MNPGGEITTFSMTGGRASRSSGWLQDEETGRPRELMPVPTCRLSDDSGGDGWSSRLEKIEEREYEHPNNINEVPVQSG